MNLDRVTPGKNISDEINVIIEIPAHSDPVKYEVDKETGAMFVDRFMNTAMHYRHIQTMQDLPQQLLDQISHFFDHYKDLEANKWVTIEGWEDREAAQQEILSSIERFKSAPVKPCF